MNDSDHELIQLYLDGNLPDHKWKEFSQRLERSADMRREFRKLSVLDENLRAQSLGFPNLAEREQNTTPPSYLPWLVAAACLALTFISWSTPTQSFPASTSPETKQVQLASVLEPAPPIAKLIDFYDLQFKIPINQ